MKKWEEEILKEIEAHTPKNSTIEPTDETIEKLYSPKEEKIRKNNERNKNSDKKKNSA